MLRELRRPAHRMGDQRAEAVVELFGADAVVFGGVVQQCGRQRFGRMDQGTAQRPCVQRHLELMHELGRDPVLALAQMQAGGELEGAQRQQEAGVAIGGALQKVAQRDSELLEAFHRFTGRFPVRGWCHGSCGLSAVA